MSEITVRTRYFAYLREAIGHTEEVVELPEGATVMDFVRKVIELHGSEIGRFVLDERGRLRRSIRVALNGETVEESIIDRTVLKSGDVVVILPPISGGSGYLLPP
ncbi:MAG: MoaD/ThiS family protein [Nitrososphaerota archaeon]|nr:MoaD/ThiS family protein [Nitrososphaerota archaeon]